MQFKIAFAALGATLFVPWVEAGWLSEKPVLAPSRQGWSLTERANDNSFTRPSIVIPTNFTEMDLLILNFATVLEQMEHSFFISGLKNFSQNAFDKAGYPKSTYSFYQQVAANAQAHIDGLQSVLGSGTPQPCTFDFGVEDISTFVQISDIIETTSTAVYTSGLQYLGNQDLHVAAASILGTKARQSAWISGVIRGASPVYSAWETPLDLDQVWTLATNFIVSCPQSNTPLPTRLFNPLHVSPSNVGAGHQIKLDFVPLNATSGTYWAAFLQGLETTYIPLEGKTPYTVTIPKALTGFSYLIITNETERISNDFVTMAGPAVLDFPSNGHPVIVPR